MKEDKHMSDALPLGLLLALTGGILDAYTYLNRGAVFATADFAQGGADVAIQSVLGHMLVKGMLVYSGGGAWGLPYIHLGAVALKENFEASKPMFRTFGERVAQKAKELFEPGK